MNLLHLFLRPATAHPPVDRGRPVSSAEQEISLEHGALLRQLGSVQQRVGAQLRSGALYQSQLESENLRLRAELVTLRTALFWGLGHAALSRPAHPRRSASKAVTDPALGDAHRVICQTGCVGHAHHWLGAAGQCLRSGQPCDQLVSDSEGGSSSATY